MRLSSIPAKEAHSGRSSRRAAGRSFTRRAVTPDLIVEAGAAIADRDGIDALSLTRVADALGVTQPALYNHVDGADDLLRRLALLARRMLAQRLRDAAVGRACDDAVAAVAHAWRSFVQDHPGLYAATDRHPLSGFHDLEDAVADIVVVLERVVAGYGVAPEDAEYGAWSVRSALHGFAVLEAEHGHPALLDLDEAFTRLVRLLCAGLREIAR
jgi:AcrR family transcriptional regulator